MIKSMLSLVLILFLHSLYGQVENNWTIMHYAVGSNSSEQDLLSDIQEMKDGKTSDAYELVTLIDRTEGYSEDSTTLGSNFVDTKLYRIHKGDYEELNGGKFLKNISIESETDLNMGDAEVLKNFIRYCKANYPANHYMLILRSHGNGIAMCPDGESGTTDRLYPGELQNILTDEESVDILGLDVCSMAGLENLYEWRPSLDGNFSADFVIASAPLSAAWAYDQILGRLQVDPNSSADLDNNHFEDGPEKILDPSKMSPEAFGKLLMEEIYDNQAWASWGLFDNRFISEVKDNIDALSTQLVTENKENVKKILVSTFAYHHQTSNDLEIAQLTFPYVDAYAFYKNLSEAKVLSNRTRDLAKKVIQSIDGLVIYSFYGRGFLPEISDFEEGKNGVYQILPIGDKIFSQSKRSFWSHTTWFHPSDKSSDSNSFGQYDWCIENAIEGNDKVENFFEYLDFLFDDQSKNIKGSNEYAY